MNKAEKEKTIYSERADVEFQFGDIMGIEVVYDPTPDPHPEPDDTEIYIFDWTLKFKLRDGREVQHCYYCDEESAKWDAYIYALDCWSGRED